MAFACALVSVATIPLARGDETQDLLFFSGDLMGARNFAGLGWLHAASGLDLSGPVFETELGRQQSNQAYGQASAGWRYSRPGLAFTLVGGAELAQTGAPAVRPLIGADVWWEATQKWMTNAQFQATPAYVSWRFAAGFKTIENWPWIGPEAAATTGEWRTGMHATGLQLGDGVEARASLGVARRNNRNGPYGELSPWKRF